MLAPLDDVSLVRPATSTAWPRRCAPQIAARARRRSRADGAATDSNAAAASPRSPTCSTTCWRPLDPAAPLVRLTRYSRADACGRSDQVGGRRPRRMRSPGAGARTPARAPRSMTVLPVGCVARNRSRSRCGPAATRPRAAVLRRDSSPSTASPTSGSSSRAGRSTDYRGVTVIDVGDSHRARLRGLTRCTRAPRRSARRARGRELRGAAATPRPSFGDAWIADAARSPPRRARSCCTSTSSPPGTDRPGGLREAPERRLAAR